MKNRKSFLSNILLWTFLLFGTLVKGNPSLPSWALVDPYRSFSSFSWETVYLGLTPKMVESLQKSEYVSSTRDMISIFWINDKVWAVFPCRLVVLEWNGTSWINLYKGYSAGFNCQPQFFVREGKLYCYGRYGYWRSHSEILSFDPTKGSWENLHAQNIPIYFAGMGTFVSGDYFISFMGQRIHQSGELHLYEPHGYYLNFKTQKWLPLRSTLTTSPSNFGWFTGRVFDLPNYGIKHFDYNAELGLLILDKNDLSLHFAKVDWKDYDEFNLAVAFGDSLVVYNEKGKYVQISPKSALKEIFQPVGQIFLEDTKTSYIDRIFSSKVVLAGILFGIISFLLFLWKRNRKIQEKEFIKEQDEGDIQKFFQILSSHSVLILDVEAIDELLNLQEIENFDYRRVRRSRLIKSINDYSRKRTSSDLILRKKSPTDRRVILYHINQAQD